MGTNDFTITAGQALVGGQLVVLAANTSYQNQPFKANVKPLPAGVSSISLRAFTRLVTEAEDAALNNAGAGDVGSVTSIRDKVEWEVVVTPGNAIPAGQIRLAAIDTAANTITDQRQTGLNLTTVRDEITTARGTRAGLDKRLDTSLDPSGALKANVVGKAQLLDNAVSINELSRASVFNNESSIAAGGQLVLNIDKLDGHGFYLISVRQVAPRDPSAGTHTQSFTWRQQATVAKPAAVGAPYTHAYQVVIQNLDPANAITVACRAYRITET